MLVRIQKDKNKNVRREKFQPQYTEKVHNTTEPYKYVVYFCIKHKVRKRKIYDVNVLNDTIPVDIDNIKGYIKYDVRPRRVE